MTDLTPDLTPAPTPPEPPAWTDPAAGAPDEPERRPPYEAPEGKQWLWDQNGNPVLVDDALTFGKAGDEQPFPFGITGEVFYAVAGINADDYGKLAAMIDAMPKPQIGPDGKPVPTDQSAEEAQQTLEMVSDMIELFLTEESVERLSARLRSRERPVTVPQLMDIIPTFLERYMPKKADGDKAGNDPSQPTSG